MRVLVTGGAGYIGYSLVEKLAVNPQVEEVTVFDNLARKNYALFTHGDFGKARVRFVKGELLDDRTLARALKGVDTVFHLAAKVSTPYADQEAHSFDQINHWGTAHLVRLVSESPVKRFIHLSSASVYGSSEEEVDERTAPNPGSVYGVSKLKSEGQLGRLEGRARVHIIRAGNVYGFNPAFRIDAVINRFLFEARTSGRITINGSGQQSRAFIHVDKLAAVLAQIPGSALDGGIYNLVEHNLSIREVAEQVADLVPGLEHLSINQNMPLRKVRISVPCKIITELDMPSAPLEAELQEFLDRLGSFR